MLQKSIKQIDVKQLNILQCYMTIKHLNVHMTSNKSYYSHKLENKFSKLPGTDLSVRHINHVKHLLRTVATHSKTDLP